MHVIDGKFQLKFHEMEMYIQLYVKWIKWGSQHVGK
jgi:hypothetical protein